jgi:DUF4097 and DUF4098 domain-containing protein YvlB
VQEDVMSRRPLVVAALLAFPVVACTAVGPPARFTETRTFAASAGKLVKLDLASLDAAVTVVPGTTISVRVSLDARSSSSGGAKAWIESHTPVFADSPGRLEVTLPTTRHRFLFFSFMEANGRVEVTVPPSCDLEVRTASGDVTLSGEAALDGTVRIRTASGDLTVQGGARDLVVKTASGDVTISVPRLASLEANTSSGDVTLTAGAGHVLIDTTSGDVHLEGLTGDLSARTTSGDLRASWKDLEAGHRVDVTSTSGEVSLSLPPAATPAGTLSTSSGDLHSAWDGAWDHRHKRFTLEAGAAVRSVAVEVRTTSGDVDLAKAQ